MKRVLSLVLALVMVFGTIMPAFAESTDSQAALDLQSYGVIAGTENGLDEATALTRAMMATILADLYDMKAEATAYAFASSFTDVAEGVWYTPYIAFAEQQGWMSGDAAGGTFRPNDTISAQEVNALFVKVLGYSVEWADVNAKAVELEVAVVAADDTKVLRGEAFAALRAALDVPKMDETTTLGSSLELANYVSPTPATPDALEVVSVTALNLIQVEVVFNQEVDADSAEDKGNYTVEDMDIADAALQADMMTVVLTLDANAAQQATADVTVDAVETAEEVALEEVVFEDVAFLDTTIPTILSLEVVGIDTIKVTFSEPMTTASLEAKANYSVDGGDLYINTVTAMNNNTEANITLYSDLSEGDVTVKVKAAVEDEAGFGVVQNTLTATVTEDADAPVVVAFKDATTTGVTLVFSEEIEIANDAKANYYHTNSNNPIDADIDTETVITATTDLSSDGKELTLNFTTNELPQGTAYIYILKESVNDLWDNENAQIMFKVEITLDETAPEVASIKVKTEKQIQVKFTEAVVEADAEDEDNYTILQDGEEVEDVIDDINYAAKVATIDFNDTLSGDYTIVVKNIEDPAENEMATATVEFSVDDLTAPVFTDFSATVYNSGATNQMIRIAFGEEMNAEGNYSVVDPANYTINGVLLTKLVDDYDAEIALVDNGKAVQITVSIDTSTTATPNGVDLVAGTGAANGIALGRVADAAGNYTVAYTGSIDIDAAGTVNISKVQVTGTKTVVVTFDDLLSDFVADDLVVQSVTAKTVKGLAKRAISMNSKGNTVVTLTLTTALTYDAKVAGTVADAGQGIEVSITAATNGVESENAFGELLAVEIVVAVDKTAAELNDDGVAKILTSWEDYLVDSGTNEFTVQFSENITTSNVALLGNDLIVKADNDALVLSVDYSVAKAAPTTDTLVFTLLGDYVGFTGEVSVERAATTNYLTDIAGNDVDAFDTGDCDIATAITLVAYNAAIANVLEANYSVASWTTYQIVVAANVVTITDTQPDINDATDAITAAQADLSSALASFTPLTLAQTGDVLHADVQYANATAVIAALPTTVAVTLVDSSVVNVPVTWLDTDTYNNAAAAAYTFTAVWGTMPATSDNSLSLAVPTVEVTVVAGVTGSLTSFTPLTLTQTGDVTNTNVQYATAGAVIAVLPTTVAVTLEDSNVVNVPVTWVDTDTYNNGAAATYTFTAVWGTLPAIADNDDTLAVPTVDLIVAP